MSFIQVIISSSNTFLEYKELKSCLTGKNNLPTRGYPEGADPIPTEFEHSKNINGLKIKLKFSSNEDNIKQPSHSNTTTYHHITKHFALFKLRKLVGDLQ